MINKEQKREHQKRWRQKHKGEIREYYKKWSQKQTDKQKEYQKKYQKEYRQQHKDRQNEYHREYRQEHKKKKIEEDKKYRQKHPGRLREYRKTHREQGNKSSRKYKATKMKANFWELWMDVVWQQKLIETNGYCPLCHKFIGIDKLTMDHIIPLNKGGLHRIDNVQPLCISCNCSKQDKIKLKKKKEILNKVHYQLF